MNIFQFQQKFPTEKSCKDYIKELRLKRGITCKKCKTKTKHYWLENIEKFQCSECNSRTNLKSGTIMEKSKIPFKTWFMCIHLMTSTKKPFSSLELQRQLGSKFYEPIWYMMGKIRKSMGSRDGLYKLKGVIELDDSFFEVVDLPKRDKLGVKITEETKLKRGRGSQRQRKVLVMVESNPTENTNPHKKDRKMGYVKMVVIDDINNVGVNYEIKKSVNEDSHIISDGYRGFSRVGEQVREHTQMVVKPEESMKKLPWVHTIISNVKRELLGVHHSIGSDYLQEYLNEFCYKVNRRNFESDLFERMIICGSDNK